MAPRIVTGLRDDSLPNETLGKIVYEELRRKDPNRVILVESNSGKEFNYGQILQKSVMLANNLRRLGIEKGDIITILSHNQCTYLTVLLASLFNGTKINLLNPEYTKNELKHLFSICIPKIVFCSAQVLGKVTDLGKEFPFQRIIVLDQRIPPNGVPSVITLSEGFDPTENFQPMMGDINETTLILTSSGTTGMPKQVPLTHSNLRCCLLCIKDPELLNINEKETLIGYLPFFHILGFHILVASILFGVKLIVMDKFTPDHFLKIIQDYQVTQSFFTPTTLGFLAKSPLVDHYDTSSLRDSINGAACLTKEFAEMVEKRLNCPVRQAYGLTETSGGVTVVPRNVVKPGSVGKVIANTSIKVCDPKTGITLGPHQPGEIRIKGNGVMMGYCANETPPFDEEGFLKTGDLGYYDEDDYFYIVDRLKDILKYKGFQVSPAEIESIIMEHPAVKEVAVIGIDDERVGEVPFALIVRQPDKFVSEEEIVQYIEDHVSSYKRIHGVKFLAEIPKNSTGKINRRDLKKLVSLNGKL